MKVWREVDHYDGSGDITAWLAKYKLVARLAGVEENALVLPLFLEGVAFAEYNVMSETDKQCTRMIEQRLMYAFGDDDSERCGRGRG